MSASSIAALMLVATLVLTGCGTDEPSAAAPPPDAPTPAPSAVPTAVTPTEPEPEVEPDDAQVIAITVAGGEVSGDTGRVEVAMGTRVRLTVTADTADEIHVHGFELYEDVSPGQASQLEFVADRPGVFEVELHDSRQVLTRLQIA
jgi:uncharacterized lipoprotein YajG